MESILLGVNIDHVATLRQARGTPYPDPVQAAFEAEQGGADSITIHLREDRRHIQERDVRILKDTLSTPMNLEMAVTDEMLTIAEDVKPEFCCLVPEKREELTTEGGLDINGQKDRIAEAVQKLTAAGIRVSLFIDADPEQIEAASKIGAPAIEIHTGHFADADNSEAKTNELKKIVAGVEQGTIARIQVNAGHGLNYHNVQSSASIPGIDELNIGHSIIARAIFTGLENAVSEMKRLMLEARN
ncbi:MAG: pyridoxine 5'-phosphate synthase [Gammaproteobacteria bacterium]